MRVYYAVTTYHILCCTLHRMTQPTDEKCVLLLSDIHRNSVAFAERYRNAGIFDDVLLLGEADVTDFARSLDRRKIPSYIVMKLCCRMIKKRLPIKISNGDELYLCPDHFPFGWYVVTSKRRYNCFEEGCGVMSDRAFALSNMSRNKTQRKLFDKLKLFGDNDYCARVFADAEKQAAGYVNPKMTDFSVSKILRGLSESDMNRLLAMFGCKKQKINSPAALILTQHLANLGLMSLEQQHRLYTLFADILLPDTSLVIKPHPDDVAGCYGKIFGDAAVLPFAMPSELLPYCIDTVFDKALAAYSTAVRTLGPCVRKAVSFDNRILNDYAYLIRYYAARRIVTEIFGEYKTLATNANELLLDELIDGKYTLCDLSHTADVYIISDIYKQDDIAAIRQNAAVIIYLNEQNRHLYFDGKDKSVFSHIRPLFADGSDGSRNTVYVYSKNNDILERVNSMSETKELKYTGVSVNLHGIGESDKEKIRMLEGVLEATEKRLNDYIAASEDKDCDKE